MKRTLEQKIGILGGGQLARMMALEGPQLGLEVHILSENKTDPAAQVTRHWHQGSPDSAKDLKKFLKKVSRVTFESEFYDAHLLQKLCREEKCKIHPKPLIMGKIQDRLSQKKLFEKYKIPTAPFVKIDSAQDLEKAFNKLGPMVLKTRRGGYDGYGTFIIKNKKALIETKKNLNASKEGWIAEKFISFDREVAIIAARSEDGEIFFYPFVETHQQNSRCLWVKGPEKLNGSGIKKKISQLLNSTKYVGCIGIELFQEGKNLIVNELAPRVHNSGHYSQNAFSLSQFSMHLRCVSGWPISKPKPLSPAFAMINILGTKNGKMLAEEPLNGSLHWYGKKENRQGRKMGHINYLSTTGDLALKKVQELRRLCKA